MLLARRCPAAAEDGIDGPASVEADYSVSAWAETFVTSMTGTCRSAVGASWKIDRSPPTNVGSGTEPHALKVKTLRSLNQIGDR